eukprot:gene2263-3495_t
MALTADLRKTSQKIAAECCQFLNASPTPFHAVETCKKQLLSNGFTQLKETEKWDNVADNGKYFVTRNQSSIIAFIVGGKFSKNQGRAGYKVIGAHTDSPCFLLKPKSADKGQGYKQVGVQTYGGGLWHTWFDRDISLAGRVLYNDAGTLGSCLVDLKKPIMRIPNLAIHLTERGTDGFKYNKETHLKPMLCSEIMSTLMSPEEPKKDGEKDKPKEKHHGDLLRAIAAACGDRKLTPANLTDFELYLYDTQPACVGGLYDEFIFSARIDNLISCYSGLVAINEMAKADVADDEMTSVLAFYDHEEVGSNSAVGAASKFTNDILRRISSCFSSSNVAQEEAIVNSFVLSVDGVHGVHPNYPEKHQAQHRPLFHEGPAMKFNANQRYATTSVGSAVIRRCAELAEVPVQEICVAN